MAVAADSTDHGRGIGFKMIQNSEITINTVRDDQQKTPSGLRSSTGDIIQVCLLWFGTVRQENVHVYTYIHTYIHIHTQTHAHTHVHTLIWIYCQLTRRNWREGRSVLELVGRIQMGTDKGTVVSVPPAGECVSV